MPMVFGRKPSFTHPYCNTLYEWLKSSSEYRAMSYNIQYDHRVSKAREQEFDKCFNSKNIPSLQAAITDYHKERIQKNRTPDFLDINLNGENFVSGGPSGNSQINKDLELVRILDLNGLKILFQKAREESNEPFEDFPIPGNDTQITDWLSKKLETEKKSFIADTINLMNDSRGKEPYNPIWASPWTTFVKYLKSDPEEWLNIMGMIKGVGHWLILLKYTVREAGTLVRPTQLDAGFNAYHFPSPNSAPLQLGGHPMYLGIAASDLPSEYIHEQIDHTIEHWENAGSLCQQTVTANPKESLARLRQAHHELLNKTYGQCMCESSNCW